MVYTSIHALSYMCKADAFLICMSRSKIIWNDIFYRQPEERVAFSMEPFVRLLEFEAYEAYLKWDQGYFAARQEMDSELKQSGVIHHGEINFPTLEDLLELKRCDLHFFYFMITMSFHTSIILHNILTQARTRHGWRTFRRGTEAKVGAVRREDQGIDVSCIEVEDDPGKVISPQPPVLTT